MVSTAWEWKGTVLVRKFPSNLGSTKPERNIIQADLGAKEIFVVKRFRSRFFSGCGLAERRKLLFCLGPRPLERSSLPAMESNGMKGNVLSGLWMSTSTNILKNFTTPVFNQSLENSRSKINYIIKIRNNKFYFGEINVIFLNGESNKLVKPFKSNTLDSINLRFGTMVRDNF
jgi:hypothetical protein